jgi:hypothetical protein
LNSPENRLRVLMMDRPLHRRIHLSWLSQEVGPPLCALALPDHYQLVQHPLDMAAPMAGFHLVVYADPARSRQGIKYAGRPEVGRRELGLTHGRPTHDQIILSVSGTPKIDRARADETGS